MALDKAKHGDIDDILFALKILKEYKVKQRIHLDVYNKVKAYLENELENAERKG